MAALALLCACQPKLVIIHTNDTHSHFEPLRGGERDGMGGAIERAAFVDSVRARYGEDRVLLVHAGDFSQGSSYFTVLKGEVETAVSNAMRYDCMTLGNHEFDNGVEALRRRIAQMQSPVVCANIDLSAVGLDSLIAPHLIINKGGKKIGIIGLEAPLEQNVSHSISQLIPELDPVESVRTQTELLKAEGCDMIIVLSHRGYEEDQELAAATSGVDLFIGGHTHTFVDGFKYVRNSSGRRVPIITDGCWGLEMGEVKVWR